MFDFCCSFEELRQRKMEKPIDPTYEFIEAPRFMNFLDVLDDQDAQADSWFGKFEILNVTENVLF